MLYDNDLNARRNFPGAILKLHGVNAAASFSNSSGNPDWRFVGIGNFPRFGGGPGSKVTEGILDVLMALNAETVGRSNEGRQATFRTKKVESDGTVSVTVMQSFDLASACIVSLQISHRDPDSGKMKTVLTQNIQWEQQAGLFLPIRLDAEKRRRLRIEDRWVNQVETATHEIRWLALNEEVQVKVKSADLLNDPNLAIQLTEWERP